MKKRILVTGGTGYIGSHICVELLESGHDVVVIDDFSNSKPDVLDSIYKITGKHVKFYEFNVLDEEKTESVFKENKLDAVIHCAAFKAVGESVQKPIEYYTNNLMTTLVVAKMMKKYHVPSIVFSSSATVYGDPEVVPLTEDCKLGETTNPYGATKAMMERILTDVQFANPEMSVTLLRYFNPIGAHESGLIGENPKGIPNNLMPYISQVAVGKLEKLGVLEHILNAVVKRINSDGSMILVTLIVGYITSLISCSQPMSHVLTGRLMAPVFKERKVAPEILSRCLEDSGTMAGPMIPWHGYGVYMAGTLGVAWAAFFPYLFLLYLTPIFSIIYGFTGISIKHVSGEEVAE